MNKKILVVDDDETVRELIRAALRSYDIVEGTNGLEALEKISTEHPALLLLDVMMPKMNGFEVVEALKANPETAEIPILLMSARGDSGTLERGQSAGVHSYITKPFSPRALLEKVDNILGAQLPGG